VEELVAPFYSTKPEGMGMGLAICRSIVEAHHGAFDAAASPLGGARFSFTLPVVGAAGASSPAATDADPVPEPAREEATAPPATPSHRP
jgi:two-component system sensor histidine kinase DctS